MKRILVIEDDKEINKMLSSFLEEQGYEVISVFDGREASRKLKEEYDLILMDLMLPFKPGEILVRELREFSKVPVIVLSAKSMMETRLEVLRMGADDYILKPFDLNEVLVRMEVVLRRTMPEEEEKPKIYQCKDLVLYPDENRVVFRDKNISLTQKEWLLLKLLMENPKKTFSKANLYETVWQDVYYYEDNTINVHMSNLRSKLKKETGQEYIETVWGIGYRLKEY